MAKDHNILDALHVIVEPGADVTHPGNCAWKIEGAPMFHGTYRTVERTRKEAARLIARVLDGLPRTKADPAGYPPLYRALAEAYTTSRRIEMVILAPRNDLH